MSQRACASRLASSLTCNGCHGMGDAVNLAQPVVLRICYHNSTVLVHSYAAGMAELGLAGHHCVMVPSTACSAVGTPYTAAVCTCFTLKASMGRQASTKYGET